MKLNFKRFVKKLKKNQSGLALTEFAATLPIFLSLGAYGLEISNLAITNLRLSQAALSLADNASRLGQTNNGVIAPTINEEDVVRALQGAGLQGGDLNIYANGRAILSSLERDANGNQIIRWQRCKGIYDTSSLYGNEGLNGTDTAGFNGLGRAGAQVFADVNSAVMFVELEYQFEGFFGDLFIDAQVLRQEASFNVRDDRNLTAGLNSTGGSNAPCSVFDEDFS